MIADIELGFLYFHITFYTGGSKLFPSRLWLQECLHRLVSLGLALIVVFIITGSYLLRLKVSVHVASRLALSLLAADSYGQPPVSDSALELLLVTYAPLGFGPYCRTGNLRVRRLGCASFSPRPARLVIDHHGHTSSRRRLGLLIAALRSARRRLVSVRRADSLLARRIGMLLLFASALCLSGSNDYLNVHEQNSRIMVLMMTPVGRILFGSFRRSRCGCVGHQRSLVLTSVATDCWR